MGDRQHAEADRTPAELVGEWLAISRAPDELRGYLDEHPFHLANLMPSHGGFARGGRIWLDARLVADCDVSPAWLLALYLHELTHASMQQDGRDARHNEDFSAQAWGLALRHGVREWCNDVYDMHEAAGTWEGYKKTDARWAVARGRAIALARGAGDPLAVSSYFYWRSYSMLYKYIVTAVAIAFGLLGLWIAASAGVLPAAPAALRSVWQTLRDEPIAQYAAGVVVLLAATWSATR